MEFKTSQELLLGIKEVLRVKEDHVEILNSQLLKDKLIDSLLFTAIFAEDAQLKEAARWLIRASAAALDIHLSSIQPLYEAMGSKKATGFTTPAINIRGMTYEVARSILRAAHKTNSFPVVFEIARSEIGYTFQKPAEYASAITAAAIKEGYKGPLYVQGDHFQVNAKKYNSADRDKELKAIYDLIDEAITAGFYNIDIDTSTLVDLSHPTITEQQRANFEHCAAYTKYIREKQPANVMISVGGEIGEVGHKNSTVEELQAFMDGYRQTLSKIAPNAIGISKMSVQTGTSHGGIPLPDGSVAKVKLDFETLENISKVARDEYHLSGAVQHGASTLPDELFDRFPKVAASEIHLATGFQNMIYDHASFPKELKEKIYHWLKTNCADEKKETETEEQFLYKTRKKGFGPFKREFCSLPDGVKSAIGDTLESKFVFLFEKLGVAGKKEENLKWAKTDKLSIKAPEILL